jgi:hypothetical protein
VSPQLVLERVYGAYLGLARERCCVVNETLLLSRLARRCLRSLTATRVEPASRSARPQRDWLRFLRSTRPHFGGFVVSHRCRAAVVSMAAIRREDLLDCLRKLEQERRRCWAEADKRDLGSTVTHGLPPRPEKG